MWSKNNLKELHVDAIINPNLRMLVCFLRLGQKCYTPVDNK